MSQSSARVILHVFPSHSWGGAEIYSVQLAKAQKDAGEQVYFWTAPGTPLAMEVEQQKIDMVTQKLKPRVDFSFGRMKSVLKSTKATHVHLHWSGGMWSFGLMKLFYKFKLILHQHMWMKHSKKDPLHRWLYQNLDKLVVAGEIAKDAALKCLPLDESQIEVCPYAIQLDSVQPLSRPKLGLADGQLVIGVFARLDRQKGIMELLKAFSEIKNDFSEVRVLVVGDPTKGEEDSLNYEKELKTFASENFQAGFVQFHGFKKNFREWLAVCDVLAVPSYHESYSLIILEAFALGIPVISTYAGGTPDLVQNGRGWMIEPEDVESLKLGLKQVVSKPQQIGPMGLMARDYVMKNHSFPSVVQRLNEIYASI
jgi:D-inositol-3-phosphate glycosyltransferase